MSDKGLRDWLIQRFTAVFLALYVIFIVVFILKHSALSFEQWHSLFANPLMQIATLFSLSAIVWHAWIGIWTVLTDYVKPLFIQYVLQGVIIVALFGYFVWGIWIVWSLANGNPS